MNIVKIRPRVWHFEESFRIYCTVIAGSRHAVLFDTGLGKSNLRSFMDDEFCNEYTVMCSHGHYDHVGGNGQFEKIYLSPDDWEMLGAEERKYELLPLVSDYSLDLGDLHLTSVSLCGHTKGSLGLLVEEERLLLAGDALSTRIVFCGAGEDALRNFKITLTSVLKMPFETFLASHYPGEMPKSQILAHLNHMKNFKDAKKKKLRINGTECFYSEWRDESGRSVFALDQCQIDNFLH